MEKQSKIYTFYEKEEIMKQKPKVSETAIARGKTFFC